MILKPGRKQSSARPSDRGRRLWLGSALMGLLAFLAASGLEQWLTMNQLSWLELSRRALAYDGGMTQHAYQETNRKEHQPVAVVEIGKLTYDAIQGGEFSNMAGAPFREGQPVRFLVHQRWFHTQVLRNLTRLGARVVAFDMVFSGEDPEFDPGFAQAIRKHGRVILAAANDVGQNAGYGVLVSKGLEYPSGQLLSAAAGVGMTTLPQDLDEGTLRRFQWGIAGIDYDTGEDAMIPALGVAAAALFKGVNPKTVLTNPEQDGDRFLGHPIQAISGELPARDSYITFFGPTGAPAGQESMVPYEALIDLDRRDPILPLAQLRSMVQGRIVVIGNSAATDQDVHRVPVRSLEQRSGSDNNPVTVTVHRMPGVEVQAHVIQTLLSGRYIEQATPQTRVLLLLCSCLVVAMAGRVLSPRALILIGFALMVALCWGSAQMVVSARLWVEPITSSIGVIFAMLFETVFMYWAEHRARMKVRRQLGRHVGDKVAAQLAEEDWPDWHGENREMTLLFSDLQGFTSLSENMSPAEIFAFLSRYCAVVIPILDRYEALIDKIMGDGVMAYFGGFPRYPDHAERAIRCALEIQQALDVWAKLPENSALPPLRTRIGLHTGVLTVGEIGAAGRAEFTVIGDIVNVAARLESMNKEFGTRILISEVTRDAAGPIVPLRFRGLATVRGRVEPMAVYSLEEDESDAGSTAVAGLKAEAPLGVAH